MIPPFSSRQLFAACLIVAVSFIIYGCGGGSGSGGPGPGVNIPAPAPPRQPVTSDPAYHLDTPRFTRHQPDVLEQIGAHHAYARGLSGRGVRIGIDDSIVDYTQTAEFGSRVKLLHADGAQLSYLHPLGDQPFSKVDYCRRNPACKIWRGNSENDDEAYNRWVRQIVSEDGWPARDDATFFLDQYYSQDDFFGEILRWREVPTPYGSGSHGTIVTSVAAGTRLGVAPGATIIPVATNLTEDQVEEGELGERLELLISVLPARRQQVDDLISREIRSNYAKFDIINRSYGVRPSQINVISNSRQGHPHMDSAGFSDANAGVKGMRTRPPLRRIAGSAVGHGFS